MDDFISRQSAIDTAINLFDSAKAVMIRICKGLPPAEPERKNGKWIWMGDKGDSRFMCSVCKAKENVPTCNGEPTIWEFCPNCGAEMKEGDPE